MHIDDSTFIQNGKTYRRVLLRTSYRQHGKVCHKTIANLSHSTEEEIAAIKLALKHKAHLTTLINATNTLKSQQGLAMGAVWTLTQLAKRIGLTKALGNSQQAKRALWLVMATLIEPGSRLSAVRLAQRHAVCDILELDAFNEDDLYETMDWLQARQATVEVKLFVQRYHHSRPRLYLYDVTSCYLEGAKNELGEFGYNRDGKKGKKQIVVGLLTDEDGWPISVEVFQGNTQDATTFKNQLEKMAKRFGVTEVTLVGDRGMIKSVQISDLADRHFHYIPAITKPQIETFLQRGIFQMELFTEQLAEVLVDDLRYILRRNPQRAEEIAAGRQSKFAKVRQFTNQQSSYLAEHPHAKVPSAIRRIETKAERLKISPWVDVMAEGRTLDLRVKPTELATASRLDGCYVIKTDVAAQDASAQVVHDRYKDLAEVEWAFRTMKTTLLEMRGIYVRKANRTRAHVFIVMLAYLLAYHLRRLWYDVELTVEDAVAELASICAIQVRIGDNLCVQTIPEPRPLGKQLLAKAAIALPDVIPCRNVEVATRKTLVSQRKHY